MSGNIEYPNYLVYLADAAQVAALQAQYPNGLALAPDSASALYHAPYLNPDGTSSAEFVPRTQIAGGPLEIQIPASKRALDQFTLPIMQGTPWADTITCIWRGYFFFGGSVPAVPPTGRFLGPRRWVDGFEIVDLGEGGSETGPEHMCRAASRTPDGFGWAYRATINERRTHTLATAASESWERLYLRLRTLGTGEDCIWLCHDTGEAGAAVVITVTAGGALTAYNLGNAVYPGTALGTSGVLTLNTWYRIDLHLKFRTGASGSIFELFLNGSRVISGSGAGAQGLDGLNYLHVSSSVGTEQSTSTGLECDLDDWIGAAPASQLLPVPNTTRFAGLNYPGHDLGAGTADPTDTGTGSHVTLVRATGFDPSHAPAWTGDWRTQLGNPRRASAATAVLTTAVASAPAVVTTDYTDRQLGCPAFVVGVFFVTTPATTAQLGWLIDHASPSLHAITPSNNLWQSTLYTITSGSPLALPPLRSLALTYVKENSGSTTSIQGLSAAAESLGAWGPEDIPGVAYPPNPGLHNAPYPRIDAAVSISPPVGVVAVGSGIYVGNDAGQDLLPGLVPHWWWVRPLTGAADGVCWWSTLMTAHGYTMQFCAADRLPQALIEGVGRMRVAGPSSAANANGVLYQWVAVSDAAARYLLNGAFVHAPALASALNALAAAAFQPDAAFFAPEQLGGAATGGRFYKGPGHAAANASPLDGAEITTGATFAAGSLTSYASLHVTQPQTAFSAWRRDDGTGATGWFDVLSYTGDGAASRSIAVRLNGLPPIFSLVVPHTGTLSHFRDPANAGVHSQTVSTLADTSTAITAHLPNTLQVGLTLNAAGVVYDVLVIGGVPNTVFYPVAPTFPASTPPTVSPDVCIAPTEGAVTPPAAGCATPLL